MLICIAFLKRDKQKSDKKLTFIGKFIIKTYKKFFI